jgi:hypothetical protein
MGGMKVAAAGRTSRTLPGAPEIRLSNRAKWRQKAAQCLLSCGRKSYNMQL